MTHHTATTARNLRRSRPGGQQRDCCRLEVDHGGYSRNEQLLFDFLCALSTDFVAVVGNGMQRGKKVAPFQIFIPS
jgi:hypothetical protein